MKELIDAAAKAQTKCQGEKRKTANENDSPSATKQTKISSTNSQIPTPCEATDFNQSTVPTEEEMNMLNPPNVVVPGAPPDSQRPHRSESPTECADSSDKIPEAESTRAFPEERSTGPPPPNKVAPPSQPLNFDSILAGMKHHMQQSFTLNHPISGVGSQQGSAHHTADNPASVFTPYHSQPRVTLPPLGASLYSLDPHSAAAASAAAFSSVARFQLYSPHAQDVGLSTGAQGLAAPLGTSPPDHLRPMAPPQANNAHTLYTAAMPPQFIPPDPQMPSTVHRPMHPIPASQTAAWGQAASQESRHLSL